MFDFEQWQSENEAYLSDSMEWLRSRLQLLKGNEGADAIKEFPTTNGEYSPALEVLAVRFGLSDFEKQLLFLCAAMEFDSRIPSAFAEAHGDSNRPYLTFGRCFAILDDAAWDVMSPDRPLRKHRLIEIDRQATLPLTASPIRADDRLVSFLKGLNHLDERLSVLVQPSEDSPAILPKSQRQIADRAVTSIVDSEGGEIPSIQLLGTDHETKLQIASAVCDELSAQLYRISADLIPTGIERIDELATLWTRECNLTPIALFIDASDVSDTQFLKNIGLLLSRLSGVVFVDCLDKQSFSKDELVLDIVRPTSDEQVNAWQEHSSLSPSNIAMLAGQFDLNVPTIEQVAGQLTQDQEPESDEPSQVSRYWNACRQSTRPKLNDLAQRIDCIATWEEIVLPNEEASLIRQISSQVRNRGTVLDEWGFRANANRGLGVTALFSGESGTGKTMAAEVIANDLQLDLYRIDLSSVINKYIGETEKNLRKLFDAAEAGGVILFFDEADALFGKRSEVKDSHDRFANIEVNYLLQRMESYRGLAILATNNKRSLDTAFLRRLRFVVDFQFPEIKQRREIWQRIFPAETPLSGIDYNHLAKLRLTGGNIYNIALNAAFSAASDRPAVDMPSILAAARSEMVKTQTPMNNAEFIWQGQGVAS